jgi:hypothetical protein
MGIYNCDRFYSYKGQKDNYTFSCDDKEIDQHVFAVLKGNQGVIALSSAYKQNDYYVLPSKEIAGFIHTDHLGVLSYAKHDADKCKSKNNVKLAAYKKEIEDANELQKLIQTF